MALLRNEFLFYLINFLLKEILTLNDIRVNFFLHLSVYEGLNVCTVILFLIEQMLVQLIQCTSYGKGKCLKSQITMLIDCQLHSLFTFNHCTYIHDVLLHTFLKGFKECVHISEQLLKLSIQKADSLLEHLWIHLFDLGRNHISDYLPKQYLAYFILPSCPSRRQIFIIH